MNALLADQEEELKRYAREILTPPPKLQVWEWCEKNAFMSECEGATSGQYSTRVTPYIREPLQAFADRRVTDLVLCFGTQLAKTTMIMMGTMYKLVNDPMNTVWVLPVKELALSFSKNRWIPMVENCQPLRDMRPLSANGKLNKHLFGFMGQHFSRATLNFVGSNSSSQLSSRPAGLLLMDEVDKFKLEDEREAGAIHLAEERTKTFPFPLRVKTSTPTTFQGEIWRQFLNGDQRYYHVPCPHCKNEITLRFRIKNDEHGECGVRWWRESEDESKSEILMDGEVVKDWDYEKVRANAFYKCQECGGEIRDSHKQNMLLAGRWIPQNPNAPKGVRSYHLNSLYSILGPACTFGAIAIKWLLTRGNLSARQIFINSTLAETWDDEKAVDDSPVFVENYDKKDLPEGVITLMSVDVQDNHFWVGVRDFLAPTVSKPNGESWLRHYDRAEAIEEIQELQKEYSIPSQNVVLDMRHKPNTVARWIVENDWRGLMGSDKKGFSHVLGNGARIVKLYSPVNYRDPNLGTPFQGTSKPAMFIYWANDPVKDFLAMLRFSDPTIWHIHSTVMEGYQRQLNSERMVADKNQRTGRVSYRWKQFRKDNHALDVECQLIVLAMTMGLILPPEETAVSMRRVKKYHADDEAGK